MQERIRRLFLAMIGFDRGDPDLIQHFTKVHSYARLIAALVGEHHTVEPVDGIDHQILLEADFIVNSFENGHDRATLEHTYSRVFATKSGREIYAAMFGLEQP